MANGFPIASATYLTFLKIIGRVEGRKRGGVSGAGGCVPGGGDDRACGHRRLRRGLVSNQMNTSEVKHDIKEKKQIRNSIGDQERRDVRRIN